MPDTAVSSPDTSPTNTTNNEQHDDDEESLGLDGRQLVKEFDKAHAATATKQVNKKNNGPRRGNSFTREEVLIVSKSVMKSSQDKIRGTDKKGDFMWTEVWKTYTVLVNQYNTLYKKKNVDFVKLNQRTLASIKSHWNSKLQPCINKFASLVASNRPKSGQVEDDKQMDLYWREMRRLFAQEG